MNASDTGFINANNWLFTSRGIPVIYYGSEVNFMTGKPEHEGNRNYFGQARVDAATKHPIQQQLTRIANLRKQTPALQRGLQLNVEFEGDTAVFYRVLQTEEISQTALVVLNKGDATTVTIDKLLNTGNWQNAFNKQPLTITQGTPVELSIGANDVQVWLLGEPLSNPEILEQLAHLQASAKRS